VEDNVVEDKDKHDDNIKEENDDVEDNKVEENHKHNDNKKDDTNDKSFLAQGLDRDLGFSRGHPRISTS
jgi:hypothetical protein